MTELYQKNERMSKLTTRVAKTLIFDKMNVYMKTITTVNHYITVDLGASSGRVMVVRQEDKQLSLHEISRFKISTSDLKKDKINLNIQDVFDNVQKGIREALLRYPNALSIGIDTWGVDYGYINQEGELIENPRFYRSTECKEGFEKIKYEFQNKLYFETGIQELYFNTIYQMYTDKQSSNYDHENVKFALLLPDLLAYFLTGEQRTEVTNLSTTGLYNPKTKMFINQIEKFTVKENIFPRLIQPGEVYGYENKFMHHHQIPVIAVCSHDTASAVVSMKLKENEVYLSSGTWSLLGTLLPYPKMTQTAYEAGYTNEVGYQNQIRFLKNINGLFIANRCMEEFKRETPKIDFEDIIKDIKDVEQVESLIDVSHPTFENPVSMVLAIKNYCELTKQKVPQSYADIIKTIYISLAYKYKEELEILEHLIHKQIKKIRIIGGGSQIDLLNQLTASICNVEVQTGASEATVLGNAIVQMMGLNQIASIEEGQQMIENSFPVHYYKPINADTYLKQYDIYKKIVKKGKADVIK